jgi:hypothetical protein
MKTKINKKIGWFVLKIFEGLFTVAFYQSAGARFCKKYGRQAQRERKKER